MSKGSTGLRSISSDACKREGIQIIICNETNEKAWPSFVCIRGKLKERNQNLEKTYASSYCEVIYLLWG